MPSFGKISGQRLKSCHQDLQTIFNYVVKHYDCSVICGFRNAQAQNKACDDGFSKVRWPGSKHNFNPSMAVDVIPYPIEWGNTNRMRHFAGFVLGVARTLKDYGAIEHDIRWGGDWDNDTELKDNRFDDYPHFELII